MNQGLMKAQVNAGCLLFMPVDYPDHKQRDLEDLMLYTQLAAAKKYSRFEAEEQWRHVWVSALGSFGAVLRNHNVMSVPNEDLVSGIVWKWIEQHLPSFIPLRLVEAAELMTQHALLRQPHQRAIEMLTRQVLSIPDGSSKTMQDVGLQIAIQDPSGDLHLLVLSFSTRQALGADLLSTTLVREKMKGNVELAFYSVHINEAFYRSVRDSIDKKLTGRREGLVSPLLEDGDVQST